MEIKVTIGLDEKTIIVIQNLTNALVGASIIEVCSTANSPEPKKETVKKTVPKKNESSEQQESTSKPGSMIGEIVDFGSPAPDGTKKDTKKKAPEVSIDEVRKVMAEAKRSGKDTAALRKILQDNGAAVVSDLDPNDYQTVINAVNKL